MSRSPIYILELVEEIGGYLEPADLACCVQVCKSWQEGFAPVLYQHVYLHYSPRRKMSLWTGFQRHGRFVRSLFFSASDLPDLELFGSDCRLLTTLTLKPLYYVNLPQQWSSRLRELIDHNPSIHTLQLHLYKNLYQILFHEQNILRRMPALKHLVIMFDQYPYSTDIDTYGVFEAILECGSQLESLTYEVSGKRPRNTAKVESHATTSRVTQPWMALSSLTIHDQGGLRGAELVRRCPNVRHFKANLDTYDIGSALLQLAQHHSSGHPSCLEHLEISSVVGTQVLAALEKVLKVCAESSKLKTFNFPSSCMSTTMMDTLLTYHAISLEKLVLINPTWADRLDSCRLFRLCPRLRHLETVVWSDMSYMQDLVRSPWVCTDLRFLHLTVRQGGSKWKWGEGAWEWVDDLSAATSEYQGVPTNPEQVMAIQRQFWRQLGELEKLETLHLELKSTGTRFGKHFSIEHEDIDKLGGLRRLMELWVSQEVDFMSAPVKKYLKRRIPRLRIRFQE
ncbi:hypothetical protein BGZ65_000833 [Modicella reniformis]|uniref:F-box domain-containing protein n=1 Tax=Modicella reniformis TaxID=1440133 RepID=A0A9P6SNR8_9FUNG|nr:hypothetical protein BGZ65_000833 [Modicella reniformis]